MSVSLSIVIVCEVLSTLAIVYGFMHEDKLIQFEDNLKDVIKRKIRKAKRICKAIKVRVCANTLEKEGFTITQERKGASK